MATTTYTPVYQPEPGRSSLVPKGAGQCVICIVITVIIFIIIGPIIGLISTFGGILGDVGGAVGDVVGGVTNDAQAVFDKGQELQKDAANLVVSFADCLGSVIGLSSCGDSASIDVLPCCNQYSMQFMAEYAIRGISIDPKNPPTDNIFPPCWDPATHPDRCPDIQYNGGGVTDCQCIMTATTKWNTEFWRICSKDQDEHKICDPSNLNADCFYYNWDPAKSLGPVVSLNKQFDTPIKCCDGIMTSINNGYAQEADS
jgi:hypothetical protein